ncbi:DUF4249 domain-containing protein [Pontibacter sp. SGAir0037]|uniref:DUF4249 domain-containing protein n=1 Tax=Pontibacter sp. SGAir0037 TaxID=2571030 RepID=UPI0010CD016B|nr:DUF4249 domain-containing protein [Pontibacter sp. SGAir0037]QCR21260.1 hypothetical protein C1N53_02110 [Pontibacter sp. SGAir0037]
MKVKHFLYSLFCSIGILLSACDMEQEITINLPAYTPQLMVECYLEPGIPLRATVLESMSYFDAPQSELLTDVEVYITHNGKRIKLNYKPTYVAVQDKYYTHRSREIMTGKPGDVYTLEVIDSKGRKVTGTTTILPKVPIDTVEWRFNSKEEALLLASFQDDAKTPNFYRFMVHRDSLTSGSDRDYVTNDNLNNGTMVTFGTAYKYAKGNTLLVSVYNIEEQYYHFLNSTAEAKNANGNPFSQPSVLRSTVKGGYGVFTNLAYDRKVVIIK